MNNFLDRLNNFYKDKKISQKYFEILKDFYLCYQKETKSHLSEDTLKYLFDTLLDLLIAQIKKKHTFELFHKKITQPFNYQKFGLDFLHALIDFDKSKLTGLDNLKKIKSYIDKKENVILLSNHQSEVDPQLITSLMPKEYFDLASDIIYVAGERVIIDPLAIPFSLGCNLLCIYSKRYIDVDMDKKRSKQLHNKKVMLHMKDLLSEGGKIIYVAPSGGRDRKVDGKVEISPFDANSLEMFYLMGKKAKAIAHFFPLVLSTYNIMPPPEKIQIELGEKRVTKRGSVHISFLDEIDMENFSDVKDLNKIQIRKKRAQYIHSLVQKEFVKILK